MNEGETPGRTAEENPLPPLQQVRRGHGLTISTLAEAARVEVRMAYLMEIGGTVGRAEALRVLQALSRLTGKRYTVQELRGLCVREPS